jgi:hypothetical protein
MTWPARARRHAADRDERLTATVARATATATATDPGRAQIAHLQETAGNAAVASLLERPVVARDLDDDRQMAAEVAPFQFQARERNGRNARPANGHPAWNEIAQGGRSVDAEGLRGPLPFDGQGGWSAETIARSLTQLSLALPSSDAVQCVEVSFVAGLVLRGPAAVRDAMAHYLELYRRILEERGTQPALLRRVRYGAAHLEDALRSLDEQTMTYADLGQLATAMFTIEARFDPRRGTNAEEEAQIARREGYRVQEVRRERQSRDQVSALVAALRPGQHLSCRVDIVSEGGSGQSNHAVRLGRNERNEIYFYDPWPRRGDQYLLVDPDLLAIAEYFETLHGGQASTRTFDIIDRFTSPDG